MGLEQASLEEQLGFYELIQPNKRLLDFWCGHGQQDNDESETWVGKQDEQVTVYLHPCLKTDSLYSAVTASGVVAPIDLGQYFPFLNKGLSSDRTLNSCLFVALWDQSQTLAELINRYLTVSPLNAVSLQANEREVMAKVVRQTVSLYEELGIFLLEGLAG
jgi:hypothetical protein